MLEEAARCPSSGTFGLFSAASNTLYVWENMTLCTCTTDTQYNWNGCPTELIFSILKWKPLVTNILCNKLHSEAKGMGFSLLSIQLKKQLVCKVLFTCLIDMLACTEISLVQTSWGSLPTVKHLKNNAYNCGDIIHITYQIMLATLFFLFYIYLQCHICSKGLNYILMHMHKKQAILSKFHRI